MAKERSIGGGRGCKRRTRRSAAGRSLLAMCHRVEDVENRKDRLTFIAASY
jgi:hypothetical protein